MRDTEERRAPSCFHTDFQPPETRSSTTTQPTTRHMHNSHRNHGVCPRSALGYTLQSCKGCVRTRAGARQTTNISAYPDIFVLRHTERQQSSSPWTPFVVHQQVCDAPINSRVGCHQDSLFERYCLTFLSQRADILCFVCSSSNQETNVPSTCTNSTFV